MPLTAPGAAPGAPAGRRAPIPGVAIPKRRIIPAVVVLVVLVVLGAAGVQTVRVLRRPPRVEVVTARTEDVSRMLAVTGRVEAAHTVLVTPQFPGRLTETFYAEGDRVTAGAVLARLDNPASTSAVLKQRASLASRQQDLAQANRELARTKGLVAAKAIAGTELELARVLANTTANDVRQLEAALASGNAQLVLTAPFAGTIVRRTGELGQVVGPTTPVFEIATVDVSRVTAEVDERYVRALRVGMLAQILPVGSGDPPQPAIISYVAHAVDPLTGAATVRFAYATPPPAALLGMSVDVNVSVAFLRAVVTVPREAVGSRDGHPYVLVVVDGQVEQRVIVVEDWPAASIVVRSGIVAGDQIMLDPMAAVAGARVRTEVRHGL